MIEPMVNGKSVRSMTVTVYMAYTDDAEMIEYAVFDVFGDQKLNGTETQTFIVRGLTAEGNERFYTGRAGNDFVSPYVSHAFEYATLEGARNKALSLNRMTELHGVRFIGMAVKSPLIAQRWTPESARQRVGGTFGS